MGFIREFAIRIGGVDLRVVENGDHTYSILGSPGYGAGTALKPASEHWILVRKPLEEKTVAKNVLKFGTGALNIDASRIGFASEDDFNSATFGVSNTTGGDLYQGKDTSVAFDGPPKPANPQGRWPANLVLSHSLDCEEVGSKVVKGASESQRTKERGKRPGGFFDIGAEKGESTPAGPQYGNETVEAYDCVPDCPVRMLDEQSEGASRFYYVAKPSKKEKNLGCDGLPDALGGALEGGNDKRKGGSEGIPQLKPTKNSHPTPKPVKLMEYLIRLITPPNGVVLDPFMGSGTTGVAAKGLGFPFIGIEREEDYVAIAKARIAA